MKKKSTVREEILALFSGHGVVLMRPKILGACTDPYEATLELGRLVTEKVLILNPGLEDGKKPPFSKSEQRDEFRLSPKVTPQPALNRELVRLRAQQRVKEREVRQIEILRNAQRTPRWRS